MEPSVFGPKNKLTIHGSSARLASRKHLINKMDSSARKLRSPRFRKTWFFAMTEGSC